MRFTMYDLGIWWRSSRAALWAELAVALAMGALLAPCYAGNIDPRGEITVQRLLASRQLSAQDEVAVLVERDSSCPVEELRKSGLADRMCERNFCTGQIRAGELERFASARCVKYVKFLNLGAPAEAKSGHAPVIIGIVDQGIVPRDPAFADHVVAAWNQTDRRGPAPAFLAHSYGTEILNLAPVAVSERSDLRNLSGHGHAMTHVAIGRQIYTFDQGEEFADIPSASRVILVSGEDKDDQVLDGIAYVLHRAREFGAKCVINLSASRKTGAYDGGDPMVRAIQEMLGPQALLVVSVGNNGQRSHYSRIAYPAGNTVELTLSRPDPKPARFVAELEGWYERPGLAFRLVGPDGDVFGPVGEGAVRGGRVSGARVLMDTRLVSANGKNRGVSVILEGDDCCPPASPTAAKTTPKWKLEVVAPATAEGVFDLWVRNNSGGQAKLSPQPANARAVSLLAGGNGVLSVGAYFLDEERKTIAPAPYSSFDVTGRLPQTPDVWAPGDSEFYCDIWGRSLHTGGTSGATALVTRAAAQLWRQCPELDAEAVKGLLQGKILTNAGAGSSAAFPGKYISTSLKELLSPGTSCGGKILKTQP